MTEHSKEFTQMPEIPEGIESASHAYSVAFELARMGDVLGWRQLMKRIKPSVLKALIKWRERELDGQEPDLEKLFQAVDGGVNVISPLISVALVGVESGREQLGDQKSSLYDLLNIPEWNRAGYTIWVNIPDALGYVYHSLHGALSVLTNQLDLALGPARVKIPVADASRGLHLWQRSEFMGYAESISGNTGGNCVEGWKYLAGAYERQGWEWLSPIFGGNLEYQTSLVAYYMALNIHELAATINSGQQDTLSTITNPHFDIPLTFLSEGYDINQRAMSLLIRNPEELTVLWSCLDVTREQMAHSWKDWTRLCADGLIRYGQRFDPVAHHFLTDVYQHLFE